MKSIMPNQLKPRLSWKAAPEVRPFQRTWMIQEWRYAACALLAFNRILNALWFEDVLTFHGGTASLGELCLVVESPPQAAEILLLAGYQRIDHLTRTAFCAGCLDTDAIILSHPSASTNVILFPASNWNYDLRMDELHDYKAPWLPRFMDALMDFWLSVPPEQYEERRDTMDYVAAIVARCYTLTDFGQKVASNKYASFLDYKHLELHYDIVARCKDIIKQDFDHQERHTYHTRRYNQIKSGKFIPRPYKRTKFYPQLYTLLE